MDNRKSKTALPSSGNNRPSSKSNQPITDTTNNTTNKKQSINAPDDFNNGEGDSILIETIIEALVEKGMPRAKFYPDATKAIQQLQAAGATLTQFLCGYDIAVKCTNGNGFGVNYLVKVVDSLLAKVKKESDSVPEEKINYCSDYKNAEKWAGDLI
jgi:hypothetical protein